MNNSINTGINGLLYNNTAGAGADEQLKQAEAGTQPSSITDLQNAKDNLAALLMPLVANALGVNAYGNTAGGGANAGVGQVLMPASTMAAADAARLENAQSVMGSYGQGGAAGADGVVGTSLIAAAENGELPDLSGVTSNSTQAGSTSLTQGSSSTTVNGQLATLDTADANTQLLTDTSKPTVSNRKVESSSIEGTDSSMSAFATEVTKNSENMGKSCKRELKNGENDNLKLIKSLGIKDNGTAKRMAQVLNSENKEHGTHGTPKKNIINLMAVLDKLQDTGQGKSQAAEAARAQLKDIVDIAVDQTKGVTSKEFIGESNVAASFVTQFGLNPALTTFVEPTITSSTPSTVFWPD